MGQGLGPNQLEALRALATVGDKAVSTRAVKDRMAFGDASAGDALMALKRRGLVSATASGTTWIWKITQSGRAALRA